MAHKKAGSSSKNGRDSVGQRLGVKAGDGQLVPAGSIIVRQRGQTFLAGTGAGLGRDYTIFATTTGHVRFEHATRSKKRISVVALEAPKPTRATTSRKVPAAATKTSAAAAKAPATRRTPKAAAAPAAEA